MSSVPRLFLKGEVRLLTYEDVSKPKKHDPGIGSYHSIWTTSKGVRVRRGCFAILKHGIAYLQREILDNLIFVSDTLITVSRNSYL